MIHASLSFQTVVNNVDWTRVLMLKTLYTRTCSKESIQISVVDPALSVKHSSFHFYTSFDGWSFKFVF